MMNCDERCSVVWCDVTYDSVAADSLTIVIWLCVLIKVLIIIMAKIIILKCINYHIYIIY